MRAVTGPATPATLVTLATLATLATLVAAAASSQQQDVIATLSSSPVLPCAFPSGDDLLVHWMKDGSKTPVVHSYYKGQDQGDHQLEQFRGRTSLFHEQLSQGNASLLLERVRVPDRGRYTCYTSNSRGRQESFVNLEVEAPVTEVSIAEEGDRISCRSEGIYPRPQVTWSRSLSADTSIEPTEQQLFSVRSSVPRSEDQTDFTCRVAGLRSSRSATLTTAGHLEVTGTEETLQCSALKPPLTSIAWRVNGSLIVQGQVHNASERWRVHVKELSTSGSLTLQKLSPDLSGVYSCEVVNEDETRVKVIRVTIAAGGEPRAADAVGIGLSVVVVFIALVGGVMVWCCWRRRGGEGSACARKNEPPAEEPHDSSEAAAELEPLSKEDKAAAGPEQPASEDNHSPG